MELVTATMSRRTYTEDVSAQFPTTRITAYPKGKTIYSPDHVSNNIYLVATGNVGISHIAKDGSEVLMEIVRPGDLFGETAFLGLARPSERATAVDTAELKSWATSEVEELVANRPRLAVALVQVLARRNAEYSRRIESFARDSVERRLARSLILLAERLGTREEGGSVRMMPLTHEMLSRYVGTSREIITHYMGRFRSQGHLSYSRQSIRLHQDTLRSVLD